jgi:ABC-type multidrug transport system fused ATPase/permease subunit
MAESVSSLRHPSLPASSLFKRESPLHRLIQLTWQYRRACALVFTYQLLLVVLGLSGLKLTGLCVDLLRRELDANAPTVRWPLGFQPPPTWSVVHCLFAVGGLVLGVGLLHGVLSYRFALASGDVQHMRLVPELRMRVFDKVQRLSFRFYADKGNSSLINRVTGDVQAVRLFLEGVLLQGGVLALSLSFYFFFMVSTHVPLTLACLAAAPLIWVLTHRFSRWARPAYRENRKLVDDMVLNMSEGIHGIQVTKVFGREREELARFDKKNQAIVDQQQQIFARASRYTASVHFASHLNVAVLLGYGGVLVGQRALSLGDLWVFLGLLTQFQNQISAMARIINTLQQSLTGAQRVFEVMDAPVEIESPPDAAWPGELSGALRFEQVDFAYTPDKPVLQNVSFDVKPGQCVAILGATGSGKTSLINLVPRFYDAGRGRVSIDGHDVRALDLDQLRRSIGFVFQETLLFKQSVADNIAFGRPEATRESIVRAAKVAGAHEFIQHLSQGYDSILAEEAVNLSGGQRQRIALARAVLIEPKILLLDDPTTALDAETEAEVLSAMRRVMQGRTTLIVANRLSTLRFADWILVLDKGQVVESGTHEELMALGGVYYSTAALQGVEEPGMAGAANAESGVQEVGDGQSGVLSIRERSA